MKFKHILTAFLLALAGYGCIDIIEPNITNTTLHLLAPANYSTTTIQNNIFWWDSIKGATIYNLQIASPAFDTINSRLVLDTNLTRNKFTYALRPGRYQWRVRAKNRSSANGFAMFVLKIDSTSDLSEQLVLWVSPAGDLITNKTRQDLAWKRLFAATSYMVTATNQLQTTSQEFMGTTASYALNSGEGDYVLRIKALNKKNNTETELSAPVKITLDTQPPAIPQSVVPANNAEVTGLPVGLKWLASDANFDGDSLYVATDTLTPKLVNAVYSRDKTFSFTDGSVGLTYYWRLRSFDKATNKSAYSRWSVFKIK